MARLGMTDRNVVVLRYFESKTLTEVGAALGLEERAAQKRVSRALEKLHRYFKRHGVNTTTAIIAGAISTHSVQAAPAALAKSVTTLAVAKDATASSSTLTLIKGALKIMALTKAKTAAVVVVALLLAAGTTTVTIIEIQEHRTYSWQVPEFANISMDAPRLLGNTPPQVRIVRSKFSHWVQGTPFTQGDSTALLDEKVVVHTNQSMSIGLGVTADAIVKTAYGAEDRRTVFLTPLPKGRYDFIANLPYGALSVLKEEVKKELGLVANGRRWKQMSLCSGVPRLTSEGSHQPKVLATA